VSQLSMEKSDLDNVPEIPLPTGYLLRTFRDGDEAALGIVYDASGLGSATPEAVKTRMLDHPCFKPERIFVIEHDGQLVATAAAWVEGREPDVSYLHMVGVLPGHRGKRLGALVTVAAIRYARAEGFTQQRLLTDDGREPALRLYLDLGYYPLYRDDTHPGRWQAIAEKFNRPEILEKVRTLPQG
jgi:mycothiol synthase